MARPIAPGSCYCLTADCAWLDVISTRVSAVPDTGHTLRRRVAVLDKDGLDALVPAPDDPGSDPERIGWIIEEVLRQQANWPTVSVRRDWLLGQVGVQQVQLYLYELCVEANQPMPGMGPKQWSAKLTPAQRDLLAVLPQPTAEPESVERAREAAMTVFLREARAIAAATGVGWPTELEDRVRAFLAAEGFALSR